MKSDLVKQFNNLLVSFQITVNMLKRDKYNKIKEKSDHFDLT